jgi:hypothetical protein
MATSILFVQIIILIGVLKFITWYKPKKLDYFVTYPFTLIMNNPKTNSGLDFGDEEDDEFSDELLNKLMRESKKDSLNQSNLPNNNRKAFQMRVTINMADVTDYAEWTTAKFDDEKVYADSTLVNLRNGTEMLFNVPFDMFDEEFHTYLKLRG